MRVLVTGGRDYADRSEVYKALKEANPTLIIHGNSSGADRYAGMYANENGIPCMAFPAPWLKHPKAGGPIRNDWLFEFGVPDLVIAFPGGTGTQDTINKAIAKGIKVIRKP